MYKKLIIAILVFLVFISIRITYPLIYQQFISTSINELTDYPKLIAHRGFSGYSPENSISAIEKALELGVDIIEFDVHMSKDGVPVIIHDSELDRTTNGTGLVSDYTLEELRAFRILALDGSVTNELIPTLSEVLKLIDGKTQCTIELKWNDKGNYPDLSRVTVEAIAQINGESWCYVHSFDGEYLQEIHDLNPNLRLVKALIGMWHSPVFSLYYDTRLHWGRYYAPNYIHGILPYYKTLTRSQVEAWQNAGIEVWAYTINEEEAMALQMNLGIDAVVTDFPDRYLELIQNQK